MDIATISGVILGVVLIFVSIIAEGSLSTFWSLSSILIVVGGVIAATLINYPLSHMISVLKVVKIAFKNGDKGPLDIIELLGKMAEKARKDGLLALEEEAENCGDEFLKKTIQLIVDGSEPQMVRDIMGTEIEMIAERHQIGAGIFQSMGASAPAFGMIGTLIGLILMLKQLDDPSTLGPGMALAMITTFYGALMANLIFLPIAGKLRLRSTQEILVKEIILDGALAIQAGENPFIVKERMKAFLTPSEKQKYEEEKNNEIEEE